MARSTVPRAVVRIGEPIPRAAEADLPLLKLELYVLNLEHEDGRHKARVFSSTLGIEYEHAHDLRRQILERVQSYPVTDVRPCYQGVRCEVRVPIEGPDGRQRTVITGWRIPDDGGPPHLTTTYVAM